MFEELGYECEEWESKSECGIEYVYKSSSEEIHIEFYKRGKWIKAYYHDCGYQPFEMDVNLLKAINKQCEELGWIGNQQKKCLKN